MLKLILQMDSCRPDTRKLTKLKPVTHSTKGAFFIVAVQLISPSTLLFLLYKLPLILPFGVNIVYLALLSFLKWYIIKFLN